MGLEGALPAGSSILDILSKGGSAAEKLIKALTGEGGEEGGTGMNILDLLGGAYSANRNRDFASKLMELYNKQRDMQMPFYNKLAESYSNPNAYWESPEYQGLARVRGNQVNRGDSGTFTNSTDREKLMQDHATKSIGDYRQGLYSAMTGTDPKAYADAYAKGALADSYSNLPIFAGIGNSGGSLEDIFKTGKDIWDVGTDVWDWFGELFG
jgi:hypothetical protein